MQQKYSFDSYDKYLCLKPDATMWMIFMFLLRPYVVLIFSFANRGDRMQLVNLLYADRAMMSLGALAGIPAVLLIYAWAKKSPDASDFVRKLWKNGRQLIIAAALLNAILVFVPLLTDSIKHLSYYGWGQFVISIGIIIWAYKDSYINDCFEDFPKINDENN